MTIDELLENYRNVFCLSEVEKGIYFERLMKNFLLTCPTYRGKFSDVWLWKNFPYRNQLGGKDLGIDIVAKTSSGEFWAIQCKFYSDNSTVEKSAVDSFIANSARSFFADGVEKTFSARLWIATTENYSANAREMFKNQSPEIKILNLENLRHANVNWSLIDNGFFGDGAITKRFLKDYQKVAVEKADEHFQKNSRGQLIMACGSGKTFTSLKIAEKIFPRGKILFLVPSISLLSQTLEEWAAFSENPINAICVCSDSTASSVDDEIIDVNLPLPAMTDSDKISDAMKNFSDENMTVFFSTYQSIDVVSKLNLNFDLVICDEAHRTTSFSKQTNFTKVHEDENISAKKRLYMTATPKLFKTDAKDTDDEKKLSVWSMDDEKIFGKEFFRISFAESVAKNILSDYKVFVLTVSESDLNPALRKLVYEKKFPLTPEETLKLIGSIQALSKNMDERSELLIEDDKKFMHTAVAFCQSVKKAETVAKSFPEVLEKFIENFPDEEKNSVVKISADFVSGKMSSNERAEKLNRLKNTPTDKNICNVLNNVRCLSEGVDVPALDAIIFLSPKKSEVEIIQAVGRVMRKAAEKKFGYIIIPVIIPMNQKPEEVLEKSDDFKTVWKILNALRAHDDAMNIEIERMRNTGESKKIKIVRGKNSESEPVPQIDVQTILDWDELKNKIYARMVEHVGNKLYWIQWAYKVKEVVERHTRQIKNLIKTDESAKKSFAEFLDGLRQTLGTSIIEDDATDMLAQHLVTRPIFESLFENYSFVRQNPVSRAMQSILKILDEKGLNKDHENFERLYEKIRSECKDMGDAKHRQEIIIRLYDSFFKIALPKTSAKLGIVYTPVEVVDFILNSVNDVLKKNFGKTLSDRDIHVLDPFTGTGTFITRLIQSGLIRKKDLLRKYQNELHANEIVLLAYYIAAINIENTFNQQMNSEDFLPFKKICLADTFESYENRRHEFESKHQGTVGTDFKNPIQENFALVKNQLDTDIQVIVGNPPYSVGQKSANDNAQNNFYPKLEQRISDTYAAKTFATNKNSLYDSYIKAFRWASDRISSGVIGFVTNAGWLDGAAMDGLRNCFEEEFSRIYVFNLRGNARTQGELRRREKDNVFGQGSRAPIAITILVKNPSAENSGAEIFYSDIGDYLMRDEKLAKIKDFKTVLRDEFKIIEPNEKHDWINQRGNEFENYIPLAPEKKFVATSKSFFVTYSNGLKTQRDAWCYNFSKFKLEKNILTTINFYNEHEPTEFDSTKISWTRATIQNKNRGKKYSFDDKKIFESSYRPFCKEFLYFDSDLNEMTYQMPKLFPTGNEENFLICVTCADEGKFSVIISDKICDLHFNGDTQCFPLYWYEQPKQGSLFDGEKNLIRRDGVSDFILSQAKNLYGDSICREDIFYYVYGFLHLPGYREKFSAELKKSLPRIFLVDEPEKFRQLSKAGRDLAKIHLNYETQPPPENVIVEGAESGDFRVKKLKLADNRQTLIYNEHILIKNIPPRCFEYVVNGRSPLDWIIDRYQVKTDSKSGIENNPNDWCKEHGDEKYILNLILSCITVSLKTLDVAENLPEVRFE